MRLLAIFASAMLAAAAFAQAQPLPTPAQDRGRITIHQAQSVRREGQIIRATGGVHITYAGYQIFGDQVEGDLTTDVFKVFGQARVMGESEDVAAEEITADFRTKTYTFRGTRLVLDEERLERRIKGELYISAEQGEAVEGLYHLETCTVTTCSLDHPHFHISSRAVEVIPGRRVRLEGAALTIGRTRLFTLPRLDIPLTPGAERYLPEIGQSADEGYFIKTRTAIDTPGLRDSDALIDLMTRLGLGLGLQGAYAAAQAAGDLRLYTILGPQPGSRASLDHRDRIGRSDVTFSGLYQRNNYQTSPGQSSLQLRGQASIPSQGGSTRLTGFRTSSDRPSFSTVSQNLAVFDSRRLGQITTSAQASWSQATTRSAATAAKQEQVDLRLEAAQQARAFGAKLAYQRAVPIESQAGFFGSSDRTPVLTLTSDTDRLGFRKALPFRSNLEASIGELADPASRKRVGRAFFDSDARGSVRPVPQADVSWFGRYRQGVYSDDTAQFAIDYGASLRYALGSGPRPNFSLDMNYMRMHSRGFTPLSIDRAGRSDALSVGVGWRPEASLSFAVQTGYDWQQAERGSSPWQQVSLRSEWAPEPGLLVRAQTIYDTFSTVWGSSRLEAAFPFLGGQATFGAQYDGRRSVWSGLTASLAGWRTGQMDISFLADFNGYRERLDSFRARVIYDMHCTDAILEVIEDSVGFRSGRTISLTIGLKGFPSGSPFGVGTRGQAIGFGGGAGF